VSLLDWLIVALVVLLTVRGFSAGFVSGAFTLLGLGLGAYLGSRLAVSLLQAETDLVGYAPFVLLAGTLVFAALGGLLAGAVGGRIGASVRRVPGIGTLDGAGGAVLGAAVGLLFAWIAGTFALQGPLPQSIRQSAERSEILSAMNERLPSGSLLEVVASFDPMPQIEGPRPEVAQPVLPDRGGVEDAARSVVQVVATGASGYGYGSGGSGWVAAPNLVVTNAHVVAGSRQVAVRPEGAWRVYEAEVVSVDPGNDVAVLAVDGLGLPALPSAEPEPGEPVAILGYPYGGPLDAEAGRVGGTSSVISPDAYGGGPVRRYVTSISADADPGNSGGPAVNREGEVVGTVFASAGYGDVAYAIPPSVVAEQLAAAESRIASASGPSQGNVPGTNPVARSRETAA
jgi:S1-C subfamily serine protease